MLSKKICLAILFSISLFACQKKEVCNLEPEPGPCNAYFTKYYFDHSTQKCEEFIWGGCDGVVPFETKDACESCGCN
jgi:hypothetical protein